MAVMKRAAKLRVLNDNVDLGGGIHLPKGDYEGTVTDMTVMLKGRQVTQLAKVQIYLSKKFLQSIGFIPKQNSTFLGIEGDFTPSYLKGDIREI